MPMLTGKDLTLVLLVAGVYVSYLGYGVVQESLSTSRFGPEKEQFKFSLFLVFVQCIFNSACAWGILQYKGFKKHGSFQGWIPIPSATPVAKQGGPASPVSVRGGASPLSPAKDSIAPTSAFGAAAFCYLGAMACSNLALKYIDYPTQVLGKACKPLPVLFVGFIFLRKQYPRIKALFVSMIVAGIAVFFLHQSRTTKSTATLLDPADYSLGIMFLLGSLAFDGASSYYQSTLCSKYRTGTHELMFNTNIWAVGYLIVWLVISGEMRSAVSFVFENPDVTPMIFAFAAASAVGQNFIFGIVAQFGPLACSLTTTTRKFFSIFLSTLWFGHTLQGAQWFGVFMVFAGLISDGVYTKLILPKQRKESATSRRD